MFGGLFPMHVLGANLTQNETTVAVAAIAAVFSFLGVLYSRKASKQMKPNGGSSFRDAIDRLSRDFNEHAVAVDRRFTAIEDYITNPPKEIHE
jgi:hypothetical protein